MNKETNYQRFDGKPFCVELHLNSGRTLRLNVTSVKIGRTDGGRLGYMIWNSEPGTPSKVPFVEVTAITAVVLRGYQDQPTETDALAIGERKVKV